MKKLAFLIMILFSTFPVINAQTFKLWIWKTMKPENEMNADIIPVKKVNSNDINLLVRRNFSSDFSNATNVDWVKWDNFDQASFAANGEKQTAYFDKNGDLIGTTQYKTFAELPVKGQKEIDSKYKDYSIGLITLYHDKVAKEADRLLWPDQVNDEGRYFAELKKGSDKIVVEITPAGDVSFFKRLS